MRGAGRPAACTDGLHDRLVVAHGLAGPKNPDVLFRKRARVRDERFPLNGPSLNRLAGLFLALGRHINQFRKAAGACQKDVHRNKLLVFLSPPLVGKGSDFHLAQVGPQADQPRDRLPEVELDACRLGFLETVFRVRDLFPPFPQDDMDTLGTLFNTAHGRLKGRLPPAENHDLFARGAGLPFSLFEHKIDEKAHTREHLTPVPVGHLGIPAAHRRHDGLEALLEKGVHGEVAAELLVHLGFHACIQDSVDFVVEDLLGKAICGNPGAKKPAQRRRSFIDHHIVSETVEEVGRRQAFGSASHHGHPLFRRRGPRDLHPLPRVHFVVGCKPLQVVDGHGFIHQVSATLVLAGMDTDSAADQRERIGLLDLPNRSQVVAFLDLPDVDGNFDTGRTGSLARCRAFLGGVLPFNSPGVGGQGDDVLGADPFAGAAAGAFLQVHHRKVVGPHGKGVKGAGPGTGSQSDAPDGANLGPPVKQDGRPAIPDPFIHEFQVRILVPVGAAGPRHVGLSGLELHAQDLGDLGRQVRTAGHAGRGRGLAGHNGFRIGRAARQSTSAAVGARQGAGHGFHLGIHIHVEYFGGESESDATQYSQASHDEQSC